MTTLEIVLIVVGIVFMIASFFITEKLSNRELNKMAELSKDEMRRILDRNLKEARRKVDDMVDGIIDQSIEASMERVERALDKESNEKIQAISEYSDTVVESINKAHNEVMFLYSMLNDKHSELTTYAGKLAELAGALEELNQRIENTVGNSDHIMQKAEQQKAEPADKEIPKLPEETAQSGEEPESAGDQKQIILSMYKEGKSVVEIAKELGLGIGEVKLIIGLFREEEM